LVLRKRAILSRCGHQAKWESAGEHSEPNQLLERAVQAMKIQDRLIQKHSSVHQAVHPSLRVTALHHQHLTRRPAEIAASQQMQMEMENGLARAAAIVQHRAVAYEEVAFAGKLCGDQLQLA